MDAFDLGGAVPTVGGVGFLLTIIGALARLWLGAEKRHSAELTRVNRIHDAELAEREAVEVRLRSQIAELDEVVTTQRRTLWRAQDVAAKARRNADIGDAHVE